MCLHQCSTKYRSGKQLERERFCAINIDQFIAFVYFLQLHLIYYSVIHIKMTSEFLNTQQFRSV